MTASGFVALESLKYSTPADDARRLESVLDRLERREPAPHRVQSAPAARARAAAASALLTLCSPLMPSSADRDERLPLAELVDRRACRRARYAPAGGASIGGSPGTPSRRRSQPRSPRMAPNPRSSTSITAMSPAHLVARTPCALSAAYASIEPCQSRWSGVMLSSTATRGWNVSASVSWKHETSATITPASPDLARDRDRRQDRCCPRARRRCPPRASRCVDERGRRRLAVRAGDRHPGRHGDPVRELDLGDHRARRARGRRA